MRDLKPGTPVIITAPGPAEGSRAILTSFDQVLNKWEVDFSVQWKGYYHEDDFVVDLEALLKAEFDRLAVGCASADQRMSEITRLLEVMGADKLGHGNTVIGMVYALCKETAALRLAISSLPHPHRVVKSVRVCDERLIPDCNVTLANGSSFRVPRAVSVGEIVHPWPHP